MKIPSFLPVAVIAILSTSVSVNGVVNFNLDFDSTVDSVKEVLTSMKNALVVKSEVIRRLAEQTMRDQVRQEERIRHEGDSGIVQTRSYEEGSMNYHSSSHAEHSFASLYDRPTSKETMGFGEVIAVINGVEFRTHRTDYSLVMPHRTSSGFLDTEPIPRSPVPPSVLSKGTVQAQIEEMAEYFRAFKTQNTTHRNYRPYFRPVLCYLEAAWMADPGLGGKPENWFSVGRTFFGANTWSELHDRARTDFLTGTRDRSGRSAYLPTIITHIDPETGEPVYAQWNFRPICQPIAEDLPTSYLRQVKDYAYAAERGLSVDETLYKRGAHFVLDEKQKPGYGKRKVLEELISQVPGLDNGPAEQNRTVFNNPPERHWTGQGILNSGYYSHWYSNGLQLGRIAMPRGFSDRNLFVADTTQPQIAEIPMNFCKTRHFCVVQKLRLSYMIPMEIIYTTPLASWNPHKVKDYGVDKVSYRVGGKNGRSQARAFLGIYDKFFYQTPAAFFSGSVAADPFVMDDRLREYWVLDDQNVPRRVEASGVRTILPTITGGVGEVRTRYPVAPVHWRGGAVWKELSAFHDSLSQ
ncbi:hypothetical protein RRG08_019304 [Elysia crispata]|uniref:Uncharacterized protein n=1 Tax=Elysia crispata TaxID=231223 RepID=A0AAE0YMD5_9GAST|nr:hypothetical protein RRG08_019304 [Elysia crispata]